MSEKTLNDLLEIDENGTAGMGITIGPLQAGLCSCGKLINNIEDEFCLDCVDGDQELELC